MMPAARPVAARLAPASSRVAPGSQPASRNKELLMASHTCSIRIADWLLMRPPAASLHLTSLNLAKILD